MRTHMFATSILLTALMTAPAMAQAPAADSRPEIRFVPGVGGAGGVFGDDAPKGAGTSLGLSAGLHVRFQPRSLVGFVFDSSLQLTGVRNPHFDETGRAIQAQFGLEIGRRLYVRPSLGAAAHLWSGTSAADTGFGVSAGLAIGLRPSTGSGGIWPELFMRATAEPGAGIWMIGVQVPIAARR